MIAKITAGSSIYGAVSYNQQKVDAGEAKVIHSHKMIVPRDENQESLFSKTLLSFEPYLQANKRTKKPVFHVSLNPSIEDVLDEYKLARIADDYMRQLGYGDQPYIVYLHTDIDRQHIHIVSLRVNENGVKLNDQMENIRSMKICRDLEVKYKLKRLSNEKREDNTLYLKKVDYTRGDIKRHISNTVKSLIDDYRYQSFGEFNALLSFYNIHVKQVRGENDGNYFNGLIYSAATEDGTPVGTPIKSSAIGKVIGYEALMKKITKTSEQIKSKKLYISKKSKTIITEAMRFGKNETQLRSVLNSNNIDVLFRKNKEGRIYGVTFIDHTHRMVFNGSRLGKGFSANDFDKLFGQGVSNNKEMGIPDIDSEIQFNKSQESPISVDEIFGTFYLTSPIDNYEEENFIRKLKKKKNKRKIK